MEKQVENETEKITKKWKPPYNCLFKECFLSNCPHLPELIEREFGHLAGMTIQHPHQLRTEQEILK